MHQRRTLCALWYLVWMFFVYADASFVRWLWRCSRFIYVIVKKKVLYKRISNRKIKQCSMNGSRQRCISWKEQITNGINLVERKNIESAINAASINPFINTAWIICSSIHIFHLYMNSLCWSCINDTFDIFSFDNFLLSAWFFLPNLCIPK